MQIMKEIQDMYNIGRRHYLSTLIHALGLECFTHYSYSSINAQGKCKAPNPAYAGRKLLSRALNLFIIFLILPYGATMAILGTKVFVNSTQWLMSESRHTK
jgi:hypothetical protein